MSESGDQPHRLRRNGASGSTKVSRLGTPTRESAIGQRKTRLERDRVANAQSSRNGWPKSTVQASSSSNMREDRLASLETASPTAKNRQRSSTKDRATDRPRAERPQTNLWGWLFAGGTRRIGQKSRGEQPNEANRSKAEAISSIGGGRQGNAPVPPKERFANKSKEFSRPTTESKFDVTASRSTPPRDTRLQSPTLLQANAQSHIRDRYNQLLPSKPNGGRSSTVLPGGNRTLTRPDLTPMNSAGAASGTRLPRRPAGSKPRSAGVSAALYAARMVILSVGVGVLAGTFLSMWDPASRSPAGASQQSKTASVAINSNPNSSGGAVLNQLPRLGEEITPLKSAVQTLIAKSPQMAPGIFFLDLDKNAYIDIGGESTFSAASTIKVPILVAFLQDLDAGKIRLDEALTLRKELVGSGSGEMQYQPPGTRFTALETITKMITISDNTATNMIIDRLGGMNALNQRFRSWGMRSTALNRPLPDLQGTNTTSPRDMAILMTRISQGDLVSLRSRDRMLDIMRQTENRSQLSQGLGAGATISHKTGDIGTMIGDVGLIDLPNGKRYAAVVLVKRAFNDDQAYELVSQISRLAYQFFSRPIGGQASAVQPVLPSVVPSGISTSPTAAPASPGGQFSPPTNETLRTPSNSTASPGEESEESNSEESTNH